MNNPLRFLENSQRAQKAKFVGFVAALCALFLTIPKPEIENAKTALAAIQLFWLVALTLSLSSLFLDLIKYIWHEERRVSRQYDIPFGSIITSIVGVVLGAVVLNLWVYMVTIYTDVFARFTISLGFPGIVMVGAFAISILTKKYEEKIWLIFRIAIDSIIIGALIGVGGFYLHFAISRLFYLFWLYFVAPLATLCFFILVTGVSLYRKEKLFTN